MWIMVIEQSKEENWYQNLDIAENDVWLKVSFWIGLSAIEWLHGQ